MRRNVGQIDLNTGEIIDGYIAIIKPKIKNGFPRFFFMNQDALDILESNLKLSEFRVLMKLLKWLDYENLIQIQQKLLADELKMQKQHVNRSINKLIKVGVVVKGPKIGNNCSYKLNPTFGWKGSAKNHRKILDERMKEANMRIIE